MPLIALDILEQKIKELVLIVNRLRQENTALKSEASESSKMPAALPQETLEELVSLREQVAKYKAERSLLYSKLSNAMKNLDDITGGENG